MPKHIIERINEIADGIRGSGSPARRIIWVETNALTSGSRNQLDLVQRGMLRVLPDGSAPLFVPDPSFRSREYQPIIEWRGQRYEGSELKYSGQVITSTSSSWRFLLNGKTPSGDSLTSQARDHFQHRILVWFEIAALHFRVEAFDKDGLNELITASTADHGPKGAATHGKWFGILDGVGDSGARRTDVDISADDAAGAIEREIEAAAEHTEFNPSSIEDGRRQIARAIAERQGQPAFRQTALDAYEGRCCITGCDAVEALEAAHITPYLGEATNRVDNSLLLRSDLHNLFDRGLLAIVPSKDGTLRIRLAERLMETTYRDLADAPVRLPRDPALRPSTTVFDSAILHV